VIKEQNIKDVSAAMRGNLDAARAVCLKGNSREHAFCVMVQVLKQ
jgi:hypothetical protein